MKSRHITEIQVFTFNIVIEVEIGRLRLISLLSAGPFLLHHIRLAAPFAMSNASAVPVEVQSQSAALVASIVQGGVFLLMGPFVCIFGPAIIHIVTLIRSLFAMNYLAIIGAVSSVNRMTAFSVFTDQLAVLVVGTLSMTSTLPALGRHSDATRAPPTRTRTRSPSRACPALASFLT